MSHVTHLSQHFRRSLHREHAAEAEQYLELARLAATEAFSKLPEGHPLAKSFFAFLGELTRFQGSVSAFVEGR